MTDAQLTLSPVGHVALDAGGFAVHIAGPYRAALRGLEGFSHVQILWWLHLADTPELRKVLDCEQPYRQAPERLGVFATRSPIRPNPVALSTAEIRDIDVAAGVVRVNYLDAALRSPVIDLKPYHPSTDRVREAEVPTWCGHWPRWYEDGASFNWGAEFVTAH
ncbi:MAG: tRNA (adenine37-N6)-methyltransferase [Actinomycetota bacterium]|nr:tRNA (adenine37-N6)-methyltransferase [Actinomycetota bacterium]